MGMQLGAAGTICVWLCACVSTCVRACVCELKEKFNGRGSH